MQGPDSQSELIFIKLWMPQVERREPIISAHFKSHQHATVTPSHTHSNRGLFYAFKSFLTIIPDSQTLDV